MTSAPRLDPSLGHAVRLALAFTLISCVSQQQRPTAKLQNPVIFVPGMPGTVLKSSESGEVLWGKFDFGPQNTENTGERIAVPLRPGTPPQGILPAEVMRQIEVNVLGMTTRWGIYRAFVEHMEALEPEPERGKFFHCFPYDWRLDCAENARLLHRFMKRSADRLRHDFPERYGHGQQVRFDIVAHSMGALLAQYALRHGDVPLEVAVKRRSDPWRCAELCNHFIMVNPINGGSIRVFLRLTNGYTYGPMLPEWSAGMLGTLPALYQLLPTDPGAVEIAGKHDAAPVPLFDAAVWKQQDWGLVSHKADGDLARLLPGQPVESRRDLAMQHVRTCLRRAADFHAALDGPARPPADVEFHLLMGTGKQTPRRVRFHPEKRTFEVTAREPGDSVVTLTSALSKPGLALPTVSGRTSTPTWHSVFYGRHDHIVGMRNHDWIHRITRLLKSRERRGSLTEPRLARGFFDRSLK